MQNGQSLCILENINHICQFWEIPDSIEFYHRLRSSITIMVIIWFATGRASGAIEDTTKVKGGRGGSYGDSGSQLKGRGL